MNKKTKKLVNSISAGLFSALLFLVSYIGYEKQNIDLSKQNQYEEIIIDKGIGIHYGSKNQKSNVFFITLKNLNENLGIYRISNDYKDLLQKVNIGDKVKVYYEELSSTSENININLIQVEKDGKIIISKNEYEKREGSLFYIGLIGGLVFLYITYRYLKSP